MVETERKEGRETLLGLSESGTLYHRSASTERKKMTGVVLDWKEPTMRSRD